VMRLDHVVSKHDAPNKRELDRLLMPLGQAIKKSTSSYNEFRRLCGWKR